jgi:hypothetical protein
VVNGYQPEKCRFNVHNVHFSFFFRMNGHQNKAFSCLIGALNSSRKVNGYGADYAANQSFHSSDGLTMKVDGSGRLYVDGDYAGVLSVLRYNSTSALLRFGGGVYGEGKLTVNIVGDKFILTDPTDGTVYYQK